MGRVVLMAATVRPLAKPGAGPSDATLVEAARNGDRWAFEALFRRHVRMALGLAHRIMPGDSEVDDIVQDSFTAAFERLEALTNAQAFASWLGSIVVRTVQKRLRRRRLMERLGIRSADPIDPDLLVSRDAPVDTASELRAVYSLIERLPSDERVALILRRVEGMEINEIARHMGVSASTVKRRLRNAEERLERVGKH